MRGMLRISSLISSPRRFVSTRLPRRSSRVCGSLRRNTSSNAAGAASSSSRNWIPKPVWSMDDLNLLPSTFTSTSSVVSPAETERLGRLAGIDLRAARITAEELSRDISLILNCAKTLKGTAAASVQSSSYPYPYSSPMGKDSNRSDVPFDDRMHGRPASAQFPHHNARSQDGYFLTPKKLK